MGFAIAVFDRIWPHVRRRWPHARVPYLIDEVQFPPGEAAHRGIVNAITYYRYRTGIQLVPRADDDDFVLIRRVSDRSRSEVGMRGGRQTIDCSVNDIGFNSGAKTTYAETSNDGPALACDGTNFFLAWRGTDDRINVALLQGPGGAFKGDKSTLRQKTASRPALLAFDGKLWIAYRELGTDKLRLLQSEPIQMPMPTTVPTQYRQVLRVSRRSPWQTTEDAPSLCAQNGTDILIAWRGAGNAQINLAHLEGQFLRAFPPLIEQSERGPAIATFDGRLYLAWRGTDSNLLNLMRSSDGGATFTDKFTSPWITDASPSLVVLNGELYVAWKSDEVITMGKVQTVPGALVPVNFVWQQGASVEDTSSSAPSLAAAGATGCLAWKGAGNRNLNSEPTTINNETPLIHEMAHMLGMYHEQQRPDRGRFVLAIDTDDDEWKNNYIIIEDGSMLGPYDYGSLMHYPVVAGHLQPLPGGTAFGPGPLLSTGDVDALRYMYPITSVWILPETTDAQPALSVNDGALLLAWRGSGNENLNSGFVVLQAETFAALNVAEQALPESRRLSTGGIENKETYGDRSDLAPALAGSIVVWKGSGNEDLNFGYFSGGDVLANKVPLGERSDHAPSAVSFGPHTAVAWKGNGNDSINLMIVDSNGRRVSPKVRLAESTGSSPSLTVHQGILVMAWKGSGNNSLNVASVNVAADYTIDGLGPKTTLPVGCDEDTGPCIASFGGKLTIAWKGESNEYIHFMVSFDNGASFINLHVSAERTSHAPSLARVAWNHDEALVVAWKGADNESISLGMVNLALSRTGATHTALAVDKSGAMNVAWLDLATEDGWQGPQAFGAARLSPGGHVSVFNQGPGVFTALTIDALGTLNVAWLQLGSPGWNAPVKVGRPALVAGAPLSVIRQSDAVFAALTVGSTGEMNVAWLDINEPDPSKRGWQGPSAFGGPNLLPGAPVTAFRQSLNTVTALTVDRNGQMNVVWLDTARIGWQGPLGFGGSQLVPGAPVAVLEQATGIFAALTISRDGALNVAWLDTTRPGWNPPQPFGDRNLTPGGSIALFRQDATTIAALTVDRQGYMNVSWLDTTLPPWHQPSVFGTARLSPGGHVTAFQQTATVVTALTIDGQGFMNIVWLDVTQPGWHGPEAFGEARFEPGAPITVFRQSQGVFAALAVDRDGSLCVAWLDVTRPGWQGPVPLGDKRFVSITAVAIFSQNAS